MTFINSPYRNLCLNGRCINSLGSYACECDVGYSVKPETGNPGCTDDDECDLGNDECSIYALCRNTLGSYQCRCEVGYTGDGKECEGK